MLDSMIIHSPLNASVLLTPADDCNRHVPRDLITGPKKNVTEYAILFYHLFNSLSDLFTYIVFQRVSSPLLSIHRYPNPIQKEHHRQEVTSQTEVGYLGRE